MVRTATRDRDRRMPHSRQPIAHAGEPLDVAPAVMIMLHGRGSDADDMLSLAGALDRPRVAYLAPEAAGHQWYPNRFMEPRASNEPWLSSALALIGTII